jgi:hypothetical protein
MRSVVGTVGGLELYTYTVLHTLHGKYRIWVPFKSFYHKVLWAFSYTDFFCL